MSSLEQQQQKNGTFQAVRPEYSTIGSRLNTFIGSWSRHHPISVIHLAVAGFYSLKVSDRVQCFCCGGYMCGWNENHNVYIEHGTRFPHCSHIRHIFGDKFIADIKSGIFQNVDEKITEVDIEKAYTLYYKDS